MQVLNADVQMEKNMSKKHITVDVIIDLLERNKDVINAQLEGAGESASIQLAVNVKPRLPLVVQDINGKVDCVKYSLMIKDKSTSALLISGHCTYNHSQN